MPPSGGEGGDTLKEAPLWTKSIIKIGADDVPPSEGEGAIH